MGILFRFLLCGVGLLSFSNLAAQKCPKPDGLTASGVTETSATLSWNTNDAYQSYKVTVMHSGGTAQYKKDINTESNSVSVSDLSPGGNYRFKVQADCAQGKGNSPWYEFSTLGSSNDTTGGSGNQGPCPKVVNMAVIEVTDSTATLTWFADEDHVSFQVDVKSKNHTESFSLSTETTDTFQIVEGLQPGGNYHFRVKAACAKKKAGSSKWIDFKTTGGDSTFQQCHKPVNLSILMVTDSSALLSWYSPDSAGTYQLDIKSGSKTPAYSESLEVMDTFYYASGLISGGTYQFRVKANCGDTATSGSSDWAVFQLLSSQDTTGGDTIQVEETPNTEELTVNNEALRSATSEAQFAEESTESFQVYPNPATHHIMVEIPPSNQGQATLIQVYDLNGKVAIQQKVLDQGSHAFYLSLEDLEPGYYQVVIRTPNSSKQKMVYKSH